MTCSDQQSKRNFVEVYLKLIENFLKAPLRWQLHNSFFTKK
jgi:hypothetical protein